MTNTTVSMGRVLKPLIVLLQ